MRKIKEVFRLKFDLKFSAVKIAKMLGIGETTVKEYFRRAEQEGVAWPLLGQFSEEELERALYPPKSRSLADCTPIDCEYVHQELQRDGVTRQRLWEEYRTSSINPYCYSRFCQVYSDWCETKDVWMRQVHKAGENTYIDYAGSTVLIYDPLTGGIQFEAQIFIGVLGASSYIYCEATRSQTTEDWIASHKRMCSFFDGVTECWVPDNLKAAVTKASRYEPGINATYLSLAQHYGTSVMPARVRKPKDKSKAESGVRLVGTQILAVLRNHKFFSLEELNNAIAPLLKKVNLRPFQETPGSSRYSRYVELEKSHLRPLPESEYELFLFGREKLGKGYHSIVDGVPYSIPHNLVGKTIEFRYNERTVEFFHKGTLIALHLKSHEKGIPITKKEHQPIAHQIQTECTPEKIREQAQAIGENTLRWVDNVLKEKSLHIRHRINTSLGMVRLGKSYPKHRLEAACTRGLYYGTFTLQSIKGILERGLDQQDLPKQEKTTFIPQEHKNVRGATYYA